MSILKFRPLCQLKLVTKFKVRVIRSVLRRHVSIKATTFCFFFVLQNIPNTILQKSFPGNTLIHS